MLSALIACLVVLLILLLLLFGFRKLAPTFPYHDIVSIVMAIIWLLYSLNRIGFLSSIKI